MHERPVECSHCKKPIQTTYKEIVGRSVLCTEMCISCPLLQSRLQGSSYHTTEEDVETGTSLCCENCHTSLENVKTGNFLGCSECYTVFGEVLISELIATERVPLRLHKQLMGKKSLSVHCGKTPEAPVTIPSSSRLATLNEALNEALKRENYEHAAWLRDQIKALKEGPDVGTQ